MPTWIVLLLAAACVANAAPKQDHKLIYEDLVIRNGNGKLIATILPELHSDKQRLLSSAKSCRTEADGPEVDCHVFERDYNEYSVHVRDLLPGCKKTTITSNSSDPGSSSATMFDLGDANWFGGGEEIPQKWPLEKYDNLAHSVVTQEAKNRGIQDPLWFNSDGVYVYVHPGAPLFVEINGPNSKGQLRLEARVDGPYRFREGGYQWAFTTCETSDAKAAFTQAMTTHLGHPSGYPDEKMITYPVWSTWAKYKAEINDSVVRDFANEIKSHGFQNSQLEIDDMWETCYGTKIVDTKRFPNMKQLTDDLKSQGFRVTIWTHPFINLECTDAVAAARAKGYLAHDQNNDITTKWWEGPKASIVDFTNPEAAKWFIEEHQKMAAENGIDGFKFDAGETSWFPPLSDLNIPKGPAEDYPNLVTKKYVQACATFNSLTEVRSAYLTQQENLFVRMIDKDSRWGDDNGLKSLVTTLLQMNMVGYSMVLPDMIGGNQYNGEVASREMFIRWLQANVFMPALQYALLPWDLDQPDETVKTCKVFNDLHAKYSSIVIKAMKKNTQDGSPVNPPIWWLDPTDKNALKESTEFLLGEEILAAPVLEEGQTKRDVYLPKGKWRDGNTLKTYDGPTTLKDYDAPLDVLPYFVIVGSDADKILDNGGSAAPSNLVASSALVALAFVVLSVIH